VADSPYPSVRVVVGVDGAGRTHRLAAIAAAATTAVVRVDPPVESTEDLTAALERAEGALVLVDDAHRLPADVLAALTKAARRAVPVVVARRPTIGSPELAALDEAVAAHGSVEVLAPLDEAELAALVTRITGQPANPADVRALLDASGGLPAVAAAIAPLAATIAQPAAGTAGTPTTAQLTARVQRKLATLDRHVALLARTLALRLELTDDVFANAVGLPAVDLAAAMRLLRDEGLLMPDGERMIPAVADAVLAEVAPAERRRVHDAVARALLDSGGDPVPAAAQLRAARVFTPVAAQAYLAAGDRLRFTAPADALSWFDDAVEAGADPAEVMPGRAEAAALLGLPFTVDSVEGGRLGLVEGAVAAHQGRAGRAADALLRSTAPGPALAVPALMATGRPAEARAAADGPGPLGVQRFAGAALAVADPAAALPLLIEAAEAVERTPLSVVLPDTPHAVGAVVAVIAGDAASAEHLLGRALAAEVGGPVAADRHRLLLAWARMRIGRYDTALAELGRHNGDELTGRERLLRAAVSAGIARRSGDVARLRDTWAGVEPVLARGAVDLFTLEAVEELVVAAARLRQQQRVAAVLDALDDIVERLDRPAAWAVAVGWIHLQMAIAGDDAATAGVVASRLGAVAPAGHRQQAQCVAAGHWAGALAGTVDPDAVLLATEELAAAQLPWEASRLAGQAAIRTGDPMAARRLLERARDLSGTELSTVDTRAESGGDSRAGGLSEREVEVARLVLAGRTYREIGAQLYISPKTVEHHVARIRTKVGATTRAEFVAAIRDLLG